MDYDLKGYSIDLDLRGSFPEPDKLTLYNKSSDDRRRDSGCLTRIFCFWSPCVSALRVLYRALMCSCQDNCCGDTGVMPSHTSAPVGRRPTSAPYHDPMFYNRESAPTCLFRAYSIKGVLDPR